MEDSKNLLEISPISPSSSKAANTNEISIRDHPYVISIRVDHLEQPQIEILIESKEGIDQWKSTFNATTIEKMTAKTGSFKSFDVFVNMLEDAIHQRSSSVSIDLFTCDDLQLLRQNQSILKTKKSSSTKRYLILIYTVEYDRIYYPLSLHYSTKPDPNLLLEQIQQLSRENQLLKSRFQPNIDYSDLQEECNRLTKENESYREQIRSLDSNEKDRQIEFLREMIRASEDALLKERNHSKRTQTKKDDRYKTLQNQIQFLKASERQLKFKLKNLTNQNSSPSKVHSRSSTAMSHRRYHSANIPRPTDRFNPTAYVQERTVRLQQIELEKKKETRRRLSSGRCASDSDNSLIITKPSQIHSKQKRSKNRRKSKDSIDSDIERVSSPPVLRKGTFNNSTILHSHHDLQNVNSLSMNSVVDLDQRLKSLEKFIKQNFLH